MQFRMPEIKFDPHDCMIFFNNSLKFPITSRIYRYIITLWPLQWRHNGRDSVSNYQPHDCLLNRLFRRRSKKTSKLRVTGLCAENSPGTGDFPHKWPVTRKMLKLSLWRRHHHGYENFVCVQKSVARITQNLRLVAWYQFERLNKMSERYDSRCSIFSVGIITKICFICINNVYLILGPDFS